MERLIFKLSLKHKNKLDHNLMQINELLYIIKIKRFSADFRHNSLQ